MGVAAIFGFVGKLIRASEWWEHKLAVLVAVAYATALLSEVPIIQVAWHILFYLGALTVAATYVSLINDFTDIEEDLAVGKANKMANLSPKIRWSLLLGCIGLGGVFTVFMWPDKLSVVLYLATWIVFSLYSIRPFRLKERGIWGVLCDATGAHFFPSLLMVAGMGRAAGVDLDLLWFSFVGLWALMFGIRGILWHQYLDMENDFKTQMRTFATRVSTGTLRSIAVALFSVEIVALFAMLGYLGLGANWIALMLYGVLLWIRYARYANYPIILLTPKGRDTQVVLLDYYQVFFPIGTLLAAACTQPFAWVILVGHVSLFPSGLAYALRDYWMALDAVYRQVVYSSK